MPDWRASTRKTQPERTVPRIGQKILKQNYSLRQTKTSFRFCRKSNRPNRPEAPRSPEASAPSAGPSQELRTWPACLPFPLPINSHLGRFYEVQILSSSTSFRLSLRSTQSTTSNLHHDTKRPVLHPASIIPTSFSSRDQSPPIAMTDNENRESNGSATGSGADANNTALTEREVKILTHAWSCLKSQPEVCSYSFLLSPRPTRLPSLISSKLGQLPSPIYQPTSSTSHPQRSRSPKTWNANAPCSAGRLQALGRTS